jgi:hypothetical protein
MKCNSKWISIAALFAILASAPATAQVGEMAGCFFVSKTGDWGKEQAKPALPVLNSIACRGPEELYVVCRPMVGDWMQYKQAETFRLQVSLPGEEAPRTSEIAPPQVWKLKDAPMVATLWKTGGKGLAGDFGITQKQVDNLCAPRAEGDDGEPQTVVFSLAAGRTMEQKQEDGADDSQGKPGMVYQQIGYNTLDLNDGNAAPKAPPAVTPPNPDAVRDAVRNEWPSRYPDYEFIDGLISETPSAHQPGQQLFAYSMSVTLRDPDGQDIMCTLDRIMARKLDTGALIIQDLSLDIMQNCK